MPVNLPTGFAHVQHIFIGGQLPNGAAVTYGIDHNLLTPLQAAEACHNAFADNFVPLLNNSTTLTSTRVKFGPSETGPFAEYTENDEGGLTGEPEPPSVCYLMEKQTGLGGRRGRGRMYLPGVQTNQVDADGSLAAGVATSLTTAGAAFLGDLDGVGVQMVLLHNGVVAPTPVTDLTPDPKVATQRRRLR